MYIVEISGRRFKHSLYFTEWEKAVDEYFVVKGIAVCHSIHIGRDYMIYHKDRYYAKCEDGIGVRLDIVEPNITRTDEQYRELINALGELG